MFNPSASAPSLIGHTAQSHGIGQPVRRKEDVRLLTGQGRFSDDVNLTGQVYAIVVRSPHAHAQIRRIEIDRAVASSGVLLVLTGRDMIADGLQPQSEKVWSQHPADVPLQIRQDLPAFTPSRYALAIDKARFAGEAVAIVIAQSVEEAKDGAEKVVVDYVPLPAVTNAQQALSPDAPLLWADHGSNVCVDAECGDRESTDAAFAKAKHIVKLKTWIQRVTGVPMEPRAAVAIFDEQQESYTLYAGSGGAVRLKTDLAIALGVSSDRVRTVMHDVGGNYGTRGLIYPEFVLVAWAARRVGRPVKWTCDRSEAFLSDFQARDLVVEAELALDERGTFLAMRGSNISNVGAHVVSYSPLQKGVEIMSGLYRVPTGHFRARGVSTNTMTTRSYRSAGRPEVIFAMERLIDIAAARCGFDRAELRKRNLVTEAELPYRNPFGMVYDSGSYIKVMERALSVGDWDGFPARRHEARARGRLRGIGLATYVDTATGVPRERAEITLHADGRVDLVVGTVSSGQGHETSFAQLVGEWLGVPIDSVRLIQGDTALVKVGGGTHSGRGMRLGSIVIWKASSRLLERARSIAALLFQAEVSQLEFELGTFVLKGSDRALTLFEIAREAGTSKELPEDLRGPLTAFSDETINDAGFPYGAHVCEVEIDPSDGTPTIMSYVTVDDVGRAINPLIIHGQTHGGIAQGVGQALLEQVIFDAQSGQPLTGSFMDYAMPRADSIPHPQTEISEVPSTTHPLGIRPAGEGGTTPALAAVINAIVDAVSEFGVEHMEMPATPERIWRAINRMPDRKPGN